MGIKLMKAENKMNIKEFAAKLNGCQYGEEDKDGAFELAKEHGFVIVFGASDDLMEFRGAIRDESGGYEGWVALIDKDGVLPDFEGLEADEAEAEKYFNRKRSSKTIEALWCSDYEYAWKYETDIPHEKFNVLGDGDYYCEGIVFHVSELESKFESSPMTASEAVYGFAGWLTCRAEKTVMSSSDDAAPIADLVAKFCKENKLDDPRNGWENNLIHPSGECSGRAV